MEIQTGDEKRHAGESPREHRGYLPTALGTSPGRFPIQNRKSATS
jgi:hypothetical protein